MRNLSEDDGEYDPVENGFNLNTSDIHRQQTSSAQQHDYVIVGKTENSTWLIVCILIILRRGFKEKNLNFA